jgi:hypothetical protein
MPLLISSKSRARLVARVIPLSDGFDEFRLRRCDRSGRRPDSLSSGIELRLGAANGDQILLLFETEQDGTGLHPLVGADANLDHSVHSASAPHARDVAARSGIRIFGDQPSHAERGS